MGKANLPWLFIIALFFFPLTTQLFPQKSKSYSLFLTPIHGSDTLHLFCKQLLPNLNTWKVAASYSCSNHICSKESLLHNFPFSPLQASYPSPNPISYAFFDELKQSWIWIEDETETKFCPKKVYINSQNLASLQQKPPTEEMLVHKYLLTFLWCFLPNFTLLLLAYFPPSRLILHLHTYLSGLIFFLTIGLIAKLFYSYGFFSLQNSINDLIHASIGILVVSFMCMQALLGMFMKWLYGRGSQILKARRKIGSVLTQGSSQGWLLLYERKRLSLSSSNLRGVDRRDNRMSLGQVNFRRISQGRLFNTDGNVLSSAHRRQCERSQANNKQVKDVQIDNKQIEQNIAAYKQREGLCRDEESSSFESNFNASQIQGSSEIQKLELPNWLAQEEQIITSEQSLGSRLKKRIGDILDGPITLLRMKRIHRYLGFILLLVAKSNILFKWYKPKTFWQFIVVLVWEFLSIILFLYGIFNKQKIEGNIGNILAEECTDTIAPAKRSHIKKSIIPQFPYSSDSITSTQNDGNNVEANNERSHDLIPIVSLSQLPNRIPYVIFCNGIYDISPLTKLHPAGYRIVQSVTGRDIDRFLYGMYSNELFPEVWPHSHSQKCLELVGKPVARLEIESPMAGMPTLGQYKLYDITKLGGYTFLLNFHLVKSATSSSPNFSPMSSTVQSQLEEPLNVSEMESPLLTFNGYSHVRQLGQCYSFTVGEVTRLYTTVYCMLPQNIYLMCKILKGLYPADFDEENFIENSLRHSLSSDIKAIEQIDEILLEKYPSAIHTEGNSLCETKASKQTGDTLRSNFSQADFSQTEASTLKQESNSEGSKIGNENWRISSLFCKESIGSQDKSQKKTARWSKEIQTRRSGQVLPLLMKRYEKGKVSSLLIDREFPLSVMISSAKGLGLAFGELQPGRIFLVAGGTGIFPFIDLIDLLFKDQLLKRKHPLSDWIVQENPLLKQDPFCVFTFRLFLALQSLEDIHEVTLFQLAFLASSGFLKATLKLSNETQITAKQFPMFERTTEHFGSNIFKEVQATEIVSKVYICGPPPMNHTLAKLMDTLGRNLYHLV